MSKKIDDIFTSIIHSQIFKNRELLRPDYIPDELPHREKQIMAIAKVLAPLLQDQRPSNMFLYGLTGTGKTAVAKYVLERIKARREVSGRILTAYVNCRYEDTDYRVLATLNEAIGVHVPFTGLATAEVYKRFLNGLDKRKVSMVVVLDEIDGLVKKCGDELLYKLTRINTELKNSKLCVIGITNDLKFTEFLSARVLSSLGEEEVVFPPYTAPELEDILLRRVEKAFRSGVLEDGVIQLCAALAAKEHGDARRALELLRIAGEIAERNGQDKVTIENVKQAYKEIEKDRVIEAITSLPLHSKILLLSIYTLQLEMGKREATTGEIYDTYKTFCEKIKIDPLTQRRIGDLINELDTLGIINVKLVSRGRYGRTKIIKIGVNEKSLREGLLSDEKISNLLK
ncbi:MAG: ORC1-type DNA replication protein [archaeon YNP-LCB-003-016]|uniref:ORC1-type DNA replication protein n=1 Tax=Candidatus Culexarchaeum yellowstonense TaxID=2928963 RepID=UPI0026F056C2|nr:ORC1-type DNA replication protein [Candidatus Culexarchaeum yellowstonense]MCR6690850.1 ORC1-type DNA replication protein [Candidatus Culexarchaeum yellowstonense]